VVYGAKDPKAGSVESVTKLFDCAYNHHPEVISGVLEEQCSGILRDFFRQLREKKRQQKAEKNPADMIP